jgi:hypothetical protein
MIILTIIMEIMLKNISAISFVSAMQVFNFFYIILETGSFVLLSMNPATCNTFTLFKLTNNYYFCPHKFY